MLKVQQPAAVPVLTFAAEPRGAPPPVLCTGADGDLALRPASGDPMLVLRRCRDVMASLTDTAHFGMAGVTGAGDVRGCPLTGAEMQSPDGGLLNMNPPQLRVYRQRINGLFTHRAAAASRPAIQALTAHLTAALAAHHATDALAAFAEPFTAGAVCEAMGIPRGDWEQILEYSRVAFAVVPSPDAIADVAAAWDDLYRYYEPMVAAKRARPDAALTSQMAVALDGFTTGQIVHTIATVSNGFGAILPVLAVALTEVARRPRIIAACLRGEQSWASVAEQLLRSRAMFPVALPRIALADTWLGGRLIREGTTVLPSLIAAAHDPAGAPCSIAFGGGPHFCPGAALTRVWLATALEGFFGRFPAARLADSSLDWQQGTLSVPREITLALH
jgi:cytochrome P450